jgi:adenosylcobinamide-phosphate synthase
VSPWLVLAAASIEAVIGYPDVWHRRAPHPVAWIGALIAMLERMLNQPAFGQILRRLLGAFTLLSLVAVSAATGWLITRYGGAWGVVAVGWLGLAQRNLWDHVRRVSRPLEADDLDGARAAVGMIVGRDVAGLGEDEIAAAAIESLAESYCDGVVAPLFWFVVAGLPGLIVYKAVNTADSMIGHREPRWRAFGWASARCDDLMNLVPARLAGLLICSAGGRGWRVMLRDAGKHASPNAGWPEAAMAGALGVRLGGPAWYDGALSQRPALGEGGGATPRDLARAQRIYLLSGGLLWLMLAVAGLVWEARPWRH